MLSLFQQLCRDVVITILSDEHQGMDAMRVCVNKPNLREKDGSVETTPMRMLIEEMPGNERKDLQGSQLCYSTRRFLPH